ncbi:hypothetical protein Pr1d_31840 [Bythopirellula goksoeyrii]|uniref:Uncharacterized protein n=1 Tax=Bythopirellula goksoeyrii TaxID=1400387 RepID=A0A5B9QAG2_9BACT|nr:hypothetical protein Pr1d_31840 [Bythopirellula goksoeyrii]
MKGDKRRRLPKLTWKQCLARGMFVLVFGGSFFASLAMHVFSHPDVPHILVFVLLIGGGSYLFWINWKPN